MVPSLVTIIRAMLAAALVALAASAMAQQTDDPAADLYSQGLVAPDPAAELSPPANGLSTPRVASPGVGGRHNLILEARLVAEGPPVTNGIIWRVFSALPNPEGQLPIVAETRPGGTATVPLEPGDYLVHAAFGRAGATKRVTIADDDQMESLVLDAGGLRLDSVVGDGKPIPAEQLGFEVFRQDDTGELLTVVPNARRGLVLRLSAGTYHVVSRYGSVNAVVRADIEVQAGKLTDAVMRHSGAEVTLKLVSTEGGEAIANTNWSVTTQDGIEVHESIGAFPSIILAAGTYTAVARHQDQIYSRDFTVETGIDRDVEVRLTDLVQPETGPMSKPAEGQAPPSADAALPAGVIVPPVGPPAASGEPVESPPSDLPVDATPDSD